MSHHHHHHHHHHHEEEGYQQNFQPQISNCPPYYPPPNQYQQQPYPQQQYQQQPYPQQGYGIPHEQVVTLRPATRPNEFLFVSNDHHRCLNQDFDIRTHCNQEQRNHLILTHHGNNSFSIRSQTNPDYYIFCSNDFVRSFNNCDFDVRAHNCAGEARNNWIIQREGPTFVIRSATNPDQFLFAADDGSNMYGNDLDVRTHPHVEPRNHWYIDNFQGF